MSEVFTVNPNYEVKVKDWLKGGVSMDKSAKLFSGCCTVSICNKRAKWAEFTGHIIGWFMVV